MPKKKGPPELAARENPALGFVLCECVLSDYLDYANSMARRHNDCSFGHGDCRRADIFRSQEQAEIIEGSFRSDFRFVPSFMGDNLAEPGKLVVGRDGPENKGHSFGRFL